MPQANITEHVLKTERHTSFYLAAGPEDGPLVIFIHGWPELSLSWRHQLPFIGAMGFRAIAPDMRGYGRSSVYSRHEDYRQELIIQDMIELIDHLDREQAVWVGHDWGSPVVWNMASHHPDRCVAVANLCVPYATLERGLDFIIELVDREIYPIDEFPASPGSTDGPAKRARAQRTPREGITQSVLLWFWNDSPSREGEGQNRIQTDRGKHASFTPETET